MGISLEEFAEIVGVEIELRRYPRQEGRWMCCFKNTEIRGPGVLIGAFGNGVSPRLAMLDYARKIEQNVIVVQSFSDMRKEFNVPNALEV